LGEYFWGRGGNDHCRWATTGDETLSAGFREFEAALSETIQDQQLGRESFEGYVCAAAGRGKIPHCYAPRFQAQSAAHRLGKESLGERLARLRKERGFTQVEIAERSVLCKRW